MPDDRTTPGDVPADPPPTAAFADADRFAIVPNWIWDRDDISPNAIRAWLVLWQYASGDGKCYPALPTVAARMRRSTDTARRAIAELCDIGAVTIVRRFREDGSPLSNSYLLHRWGPGSGGDSAAAPAPEVPAETPPPDSGGVVAAVRDPGRSHATTLVAPMPPEVDPPEVDPQEVEDPPLTSFGGGARANAGDGGTLVLVEPAAPATTATTKAKRATTLPGDFAATITPQMVAWARENCPDVDGRYETEKFCDYWNAKSGKDATKRDWPGTWRNWMRKAQENATNRRRPWDRPSDPQDVAALNGGLGYGTSAERANAILQLRTGARTA